jgi:hypothetical protein
MWDVILKRDSFGYKYRGKNHDKLVYTCIVTERAGDGRFELKLGGRGSSKPFFFL